MFTKFLLARHIRTKIFKLLSLQTLEYITKMSGLYKLAIWRRSMDHDLARMSPLARFESTRLFANVDKQVVIYFFPARSFTIVFMHIRCILFETLGIVARFFPTSRIDQNYTSSLHFIIAASKLTNNVTRLRIEKIFRTKKSLCTVDFIALMNSWCLKYYSLNSLKRFLSAYWIFSLYKYVFLDFCSWPLARWVFRKNNTIYK